MRAAAFFAFLLVQPDDITSFLIQLLAEGTLPHKRCSNCSTSHAAEACERSIDNWTIPSLHTYHFSIFTLLRADEPISLVENTFNWIHEDIGILLMIQLMTF